MAYLPPGFWPRGKTFYDGRTIDSNNLQGTSLEGQEYEFDDFNWSSTALTKPLRTRHKVKVRIVRNVSGATLAAKYLARLIKTDTVNMFNRTDGYARLVTDTPCYPIDEFLPSSGVPNNDLCYVVVSGPSECYTGLAADATNVINVGDILVALTAATTGATTAGRLGAQDLTGATAVLANQVQGRLARALSAKTTANTGVAVLVNICKE